MNITLQEILANTFFVKSTIFLSSGCLAISRHFTSPGASTDGEEGRPHSLNAR